LTTNLGSMVESRSGATVQSATAVTFFSCFQGLARLVFGFTSDALVRRGPRSSLLAALRILRNPHPRPRPRHAQVARGWPRTVFFPMLALLMACAHAILMMSGPAALLIGTAVGGVAFGSVYPLLVPAP
jgi:MFS family permease